MKKLLEDLLSIAAIEMLLAIAIKAIAECILTLNRTTTDSWYDSISGSFLASVILAILAILVILWLVAKELIGPHARTGKH